MYSYSHDNDSWLGDYPSASAALIAGRAKLDSVEAPTIYIARWEPAHYTDLFIGAATLLSYMHENGSDRMDDNNLLAFDALSVEEVAKLNNALEERIGEWEAELPEEMQFSGVWIKQTRAYRQGEEVRPGHWPHG